MASVCLCHSLICPRCPPIPSSGNPDMLYYDFPVDHLTRSTMRWTEFPLPNQAMKHVCENAGYGVN